MRPVVAQRPIAFMNTKNENLLIPLERAELIASLHWLIRLRWVFGAALLVLGLFWIWNPLREVRGPLIVALGTTILAYNWGFWFVERKIRRHKFEQLVRQAPLSAHVQIICDLVMLTLVLHAAGGIENPFFTYYIFHLVIATLLLPGVSVFAFAFLAIALFTGMAFAEMYGWVRHVNFFIDNQNYRDPVYVSATLLAFTSSLIIAVYFGTRIAHRLRERAAQVQRLERELELHADELEKANQALRRNDETKTQFYRKVSHDLKAPLAAQQTLLRTVQYQFLDRQYDNQRRQIERAITRGEELLALLDDLLLLSRSRDASRQVSCQWIDPMDRLHHIFEAQEMHARDKGLDWELDINEPVPPICAQPGALQTVVENMISNAIKYTPGGGRVRISLAGQSDHLVIRVSDTGIGISDEDIERIGHEFYRTKEAIKSGSPGTGLGMSIVRSMIESMKGRLDIESESGKGTTFTVTLPVANKDMLGECGPTVPVRKPEHA